MRARVKRFGLVLSLINAAFWLGALALIWKQGGNPAHFYQALTIVPWLIVAGPFVYIAIATTVRGFIWAWSGK